MLIKLQFSQSSGDIQDIVTYEFGNVGSLIGNNELFITPWEYNIISSSELSLWRVRENRLVRSETGEDINDWMTKSEIHHDGSDQRILEESIEKNKKIYVRSLSEYLKVIQSFETNSSLSPLFRGQSLKWPLLPKLGRYHLLKSETRYLAEKKMLSDLKRMSTLFLETIPETELEWLSIAQHYGMATRMLDWTLNPLVALWFSVSESPNSSFKSGEVSCFYPNVDDIISDLNIIPFNVTKIMVYFPKHVSQRIIAQNGCFTIHPYIPTNSTYAENEKDNFLTMNSKNCNSNYLMFNISIKNKYFQKIRFELNKYGINNSSMFPDLNGLCRHVEWQYLAR